MISTHSNVIFYLVQRIQYSKRDSDVIAKIKGTFTERPKRTKEEELAAAAARKKKDRPVAVSKWVNGATVLFLRLSC